MGNKVSANNDSSLSQQQMFGFGKNKKKVNLLEVLESVPLLSGLTSDERVKLSKGLKQVTFKKGEYIMKEGEDGDSFYIIIEGKVQVLTLKNNKQEAVAML